MSAMPMLVSVWAGTPVRTAPTAERSEIIETLAFYRKRTEGLLRRYMKVSMDMGRAPSILSNCVFPGRASSHRVRSFEDAVIFVHDIEKCLRLLDPFSQELVGRIALQEYTQGETAELTGQSIRSIVRKYAEAIDTLTRILLDRQLLHITSAGGARG